MSDHLRVKPVEFDVPVPRWVRVRGHSEREDPPFELDEDGFLPEPHDFSPYSTRSFVRPEEVLGSGSLVLLGEPGAGKTTTFKQLTGVDSVSLPPCPGESGTVWANGSELTDSAAFREIIGVHLAALPDVADCDDPSHVLTIVLDQLDESTIIRALPGYLGRALIGKDARSLRVLVACRTADYPTSMTSVLERAQGQCTVADLAPLTRSDVKELAAGLCEDPAAFLAEVVGNGVGMLASVPLTLKILLGAYMEDPRSLDQGSLKLFERGIARLLDEHDRDRLQGQVLNTSVEQRIVIASRIASRLLLSGQRTIWTGEVAQASSQEITPGMLAGGYETSVASFEVSNAAVDETLKSALFTRNDPYRVAFVHSSFAAYLAARYLSMRPGAAGKSARRQLDEIFLVAAPDEDSASIPVQLRETAAWLVARAPGEHRELALADPDGLVAYSARITDPSIRELIVDGLLKRADEVQLTRTAWQRSRWNLRHPGLADQLRAVLEATTPESARRWSDLAKVQLAVQLARQSPDDSLTGLLLQIVQTPEWPTGLRQAAVNAAMESAHLAAPQLRQMLVDTESPGAFTGPAEQDELVGTILLKLWPRHMPLAEVIAHVRPVINKHYFGSYGAAVTEFPKGVDDHDLPELLEFADRLVRQMLQVPDGRPLVDVDRRTPPRSQEYKRSVIEIVLPIFDRLTSGASVHDHLPGTLEVIAALLWTSSSLPMPAGFCQVDDQGIELGSAVELRRVAAEGLAAYLLQQAGTFTHLHAHVITARWSSRPRFKFTSDRSTVAHSRRACLLDKDDTAWLLRRAQHQRASGNLKLGEALVVLLSQVADLNDRRTLELVYSLRGTSDWQHFPWLAGFATPQEALARAIQQPHDAEDEWEHATAFAAQQRQRLDAAVDGDASAFATLVDYLRIDPRSGYVDGEALGDSDLFAQPGAMLWDQSTLRSRFRLAAHRFLTDEHDHHNDWIGRGDAYNATAEAGYTALVFLAREGEIDSLGYDRWPSWVGSIVSHAHRKDDPEAAVHLRELFARLVRHAKAELLVVIGTIVRSTLAGGPYNWRLPSIISLLPQSMYAGLTMLAKEVAAAITGHLADDGSTALAVAQDEPHGANAPSTAAAVQRAAVIEVWSDLIHPGLVRGTQAAIEVAEEALFSPTDVEFALAAGEVLLTSDASVAWPKVEAVMSESTDFAMRLATRCASIEHTRRITGHSGIAETLNEADLTAALGWVTATCPPVVEAFPIGEAVATDGRRLVSWRAAMLHTLAKRGTSAAVQGLRSLVGDFPEDLEIRTALLSARREAQARRAVLLPPEDVIRLLSNPDHRVISTAAQLAEVIVDTLVDIGRDLCSHPNVLWDRERPAVEADSSAGSSPKYVWRPKPEGTFASYIAHELKLRLTDRAVVINREVVIKPTDEGDSGERPDILVDAIAINTELDQVSTVSVPIEIKLSSHREVLFAQRDQLAVRYLPAAVTDTGVYLVAWFPLELWTAVDKEPKRRAGKLRGPRELGFALAEQAANIHRTLGVRTLPCVLTIPRAVSASAEVELSEQE